MPEKEKTEKAPQTLEERNRFLEKENDRLRAENAVLKKSIALKVTKARQQRKRK